MNGNVSAKKHMEEFRIGELRMIKQIRVAECDLCGKKELARRTSGRYCRAEYELPLGWGRGENKDFCLCPQCMEGRVLTEVLHS